MTLEFARQEALRRVEVLRFPHYIIESKHYPGEYMVVSYKPDNYKVVARVEVLGKVDSQ